MLVRLLPDQVASNWDVIKHAVAESLPPTIIESPDKLNNLFESLLIGRMVCWASITGETNDEMEGLLITTVQEDKVSGTRSLLIFSLYSFTNASKELTWQEGLVKLMRFAITQRCDQIIAYTTNENVIRFVERAGGDVSQRFITIPLYQNGT